METCSVIGCTKPPIQSVTDLDYDMTYDVCDEHFGWEICPLCHGKGEFDATAEGYGVTHCRPCEGKGYVPEGDAARVLANAIGDEREP